QAVLQSRHMREACLEIDLLPAHRHELRDAQPVPVGEEDERPIARTVAAHLARGLQELLDLRRREILTGAPIKIRLSPWGDRRGGGRSRSRLWCLPIASARANFPILECWRGSERCCLSRSFGHPRILTPPLTALYGNV